MMIDISSGYQNIINSYELLKYEPCFKLLTCSFQTKSALLGLISRKVLAWSQAKSYNFYIKFLEGFAYRFTNYEFLDYILSILTLLSHWFRCWDRWAMGLNFVNKGSNIQVRINEEIASQ